MKIKVRVWVVALSALCIGVILAWVIVHLNSKLKTAESALHASSGVISEYVIEVDSLEEKVAETRLVVAEKERQLTLSAQQIERLKEMNIRHIKAIGELELEISSYIDSLTVVKSDTVVKIVEVETDDGPVFMYPVGTEWSHKDQWSYAKAGVDSTGSGWIGFEVAPVPINLVLGSRGVLFNKSYVSSMSSPNPYVDIRKSSFQLVEKKRAQPALIAGGLGIAIGTIVTLLLIGL